jgi:hypothetical protein
MAHRHLSAVAGLTLAALLGTLGTHDDPVAGAPRPQATAEVLRLQTEGFPTPLVIPGDPHRAPITSVAIQGTIPRDADGKGTITLDRSALTFNEFGDATRAETTPPSPHLVVFRRVKPDDNAFQRLRPADNRENRRLYEIELADGSFAKRLRLVLSDGTTGPHRLLLHAGVEPPRGSRGAALTHVLDLRGLPVVKEPLPDAPLGSAINLTALSSSQGHPDGRLRRIAVRGTLGGPAHLTLDPNHLMLNAFGDVVGSTLIGFIPLKATLERSKTTDPAKKGRVLYEVVPAGVKPKARHFLVLSATEGGPQRLLIQEGGVLRHILALHDPDRRYHMTRHPQLAATSAEERRAVAELRKAFGYQFQLKVEAGGITEVRVLSGVDAGRAGPALKGLPNLRVLDFGSSPLGAAGVDNLRDLKRLEVLGFSNATIADAGLTSLKDLPRLKSLSFYSCQGITDGGLVHLRGLKSLEHLRLSREDFPTPGKPAAPRITDAGLEHLKGLTNLSYLNLMGQDITDAGLKRLEALSKLRDLYLSGAGVTDAGLNQLRGLSELKYLHLYKTRVTATGEAALRASLPRLRVGH